MLSAGAIVALGAASIAGCAPAHPKDRLAASGWEDLRRRMSGTLTLRGENGFDAAARTFNPLFDTNHPAAVAFCASEQDVACCVEFTSGAGIPIAARSGGHSFAG